MQNRRSSSRRAAPRRKLIWVRYVPPLFNLTVGATDLQSFDPLSTFEAIYGAQLLGATVMRVRGTIALKQVNNSSNGIMTAAMKTGDLPLPVTETPAGAGINDDWFMYEQIACVDSGSLATEPLLAKERVIDVRSRRRLEELGTRLVVAFQATGTAAFQVRVQAAFSILIALP